MKIARTKNSLASEKYRNSENGRAARRKYYYSKKGKAVNRIAWKKHQSSPTGKFWVYRHTAARRSICFDISFDQFMLFWGKPCIYCNSSIETIGIDRVDNAVGYTIANVAPCCTVCNSMKLCWPKDFFIEHCRKIVAAASAATETI